MAIIETDEELKELDRRYPHTGLVMSNDSDTSFSIVLYDDEGNRCVLIFTDGEKIQYVETPAYARPELYWDDTKARYHHRKREQVMMTVNEFQERYHGYRTEDEMEAMSEALKLNVVDSNGNKREVIPMKIADEWCLMLDTAVAMMRALNIGEYHD